MGLAKAALTADVDADAALLLSLLIDLGCENPKSAGVSRSGRLELELSLRSKVHFVLRKSLDHQNHETLSHVCLSWSPLKVGKSMRIVLWFRILLLLSWPWQMLVAHCLHREV